MNRLSPPVRAVVERLVTFEQRYPERTNLLACRLLTAIEVCDIAERAMRAWFSAPAKDSERT
jgi:hypothetical protein